jgi:hypothetical protein
VIILQDSSRIVLEPGSSLSVAVNNGTFHVQLKEGTISISEGPNARVLVQRNAATTGVTSMRSGLTYPRRSTHSFNSKTWINKNVHYSCVSRSDYKPGDYNHNHAYKGAFGRSWFGF